MVRTRIAPSPTGYAHIGTVYQMLFDFAYAKKYDGKFIIRIEDTDRERFVADAEQKIYDAADWFGLPEDESPRKGGKFAPYRQSERLDIYKKYALELVQNGHAYYCFCTKERLEEVRQKMIAAHKSPMYDRHCRNLSEQEIQQELSSGKLFVIRLKVPDNQTIVVHDEIRGDISFDTSTIDDQVLLKADGFPTYHLGVVVDDHLMEITHIVRGEEWITSLPKHWLLYEFFGWQKPLFYHTPVLRNPDKSKLSKRHGHTNVTWYQEQGFLPEAILNFLALMGWSHPEGKELFPLDEFIRLVELKDLKPVGPIFDLTKLEWMNGEYLRKIYEQDVRNNTQHVKELLKNFYKNDKDFSSIFESPHIDILIGLAVTRMKTLREFKDLVQQSESVRDYSEKEKILAPKLKAYMNTWEVEWNDQGKMLEKLKEFAKENDTNMKTIYFLLTGREKGLPLLEQIQMYQKDILNNIKT